MTLIQRIATALRLRDKTAHEQAELNIHQQLDRLADSRSIVEADLARERQLAERLEAAAKAAATGTDDKALLDRRDAVLIRVAELQAAHEALTEAITQRATAANRLLNQQLRADPPTPPTNAAATTAPDDTVAEEGKPRERGTHVGVDG